jgi:hypothetical protein
LIVLHKLVNITIKKIDEFLKFLDVGRPYRYATSVPFGSVYDIPLLVFPRIMRVDARTDFSIDRPAAKGKMIFNKRELRGALSGDLGESD